MPEIFYLAARFPSLEAAGQAYTLVQQLLRSNEDTDLSVFRVELSGVPIVAVLGLEPPAPILELIIEHLGRGGGQLISLPDDAVAWLFQRRTQQAPEAGFTEQHYTQETGPRYEARPRRIQRRRVSHLQVTWEYQMPTPEEAMGRVTDLQTGIAQMRLPQYVGVCDWCTAELTLPIAAIHDFAVEITFPSGLITTAGGKWATCSQCQERLRLKEGDTWVAFDAVDRLWRTHGARYLEGYFGENARQIRVVSFYAKDGPDEGASGL